MIFAWTLVDGGGSLADPHAEIVDFEAPGRARSRHAQARRHAARCRLRGEGARHRHGHAGIADRDGAPARQGLPGYTYENEPGQLWRSRYEVDRELIVVNSGHRDFVYASQSRASQLRYIARLFVKELVLTNFPGASPPELLDRVLELMLYMESYLK